MARAFVASGACTLALRLVDTYQPSYSRAPQDWLSWERVRMNALAQQHAWAAIVARQAVEPQGLSFVQREPFMIDAVHAELALGHGDGARKLLRTLLWSGKQLPDASQLRTWRRWLIESYLDSNQLDDARLALLNYQLDYPTENVAERAVLARVWLRVGEPRRALELLGSKVGSANDWLYWLAALRAGTMPPATVYTLAAKAAADAKTAPQRSAQLWGVAAAAAKRAHSWRKVIIALEHYLALAPRVPLTPLLAFDGDTLWRAYRTLAIEAGNRARLLIGDDHAWEAAARKARKAHHSVLARADDALLSETGQSLAGQATGYRDLATAVLGLPGGHRLLDRLFLQAPKRFPAHTDVPAGIRLVLAHDAVNRGDLPLAAQLMAGLDAPPPGENPYRWVLRLSRVLILGGKSQAGIERLQTLVANQTSFDQSQASELMQVLFDLQSQHKNQAAIALFKAVYPKLKSVRQQREVLFWEAQSYAAQGHEAHAASLYMQSALLTGRNTYGPWGASARWNAAVALSKAGMRADARRVLENLLTHTTAPQRRHVIERKLAQIARMPPKAAAR
ncbi:hypothetical protein BW247_12940 [Acidihalobacter ferrooxydans]|uniref:Uncharacterized protein n=2 Tax=Acidihalobacter ferrooxydans TaxID=1765967 RepID=A0A1P8UJA8_9GAMM|nr:hypothetical protein BW247_12940 [Acidihalobacter ferrooxydans]